MKKLAAFIGAIAVSLTFQGFAVAESLPGYVKECLIDAANTRAPRYGGVSKINVYSQFESEQYTYIQAQVTTVKTSGWSIVIQYDSRGCDFIGDDYVSELGLYANIPDELVRLWTIQMIQPRLQEFGEKQMKKSIASSNIEWHPGQLKAFKDLGLID